MELSKGATMNKLGWRAEHRQTPWLSHAIGAFGGLLAAFGLVLIAVETLPDEFDSGWSAALITALGLAGAILVPLVVNKPSVRAGAWVVVALLIPATLIFVFAPPPFSGFDEIRAIVALTMAGYLTAFLLSFTKGRTVFLALFLILGYAWANAEVSGLAGEIDREVTNQNDFFALGSDDFDAQTIAFESGFDEDDFDRQFDEDFDEGYNDPSDLDYYEEDYLGTDAFYGVSGEDKTVELGLLGLFFGGLCLFGVVRADKKGFGGLAIAGTFIGATGLTNAAIAFGAKTEDLTGGGLIAIIAGLVVGWAGTFGQRRFTIWYGAFLATVGAILISADLSDSTVNDDGDYAALIVGVIFLLVGLAWVTVSILIAKVLKEPANGDDPEDNTDPDEAPSEPPDSPEPASVAAEPTAQAPAVEQPTVTTDSIPPPPGATE